jgi:hypothetical protein
MRRLIMFVGLILLAFSLSVVPGRAQTGLVFTFTTIDFPGAAGTSANGITGAGTGTTTTPAPVKDKDKKDKDKAKEGRAWQTCMQTEQDQDESVRVQAKENDDKNEHENTPCASASVPEVHLGYYLDITSMQAAPTASRTPGPPSRQSMSLALAGPSPWGSTVLAISWDIMSTPPAPMVF